MFARKCLPLYAVSSVPRNFISGRDGIQVQSRDPGIFRDRISLKFLSRDFTKKDRNGQISKIICLQMENFVIVILYLVYFNLKYIYFENLWQISEKENYIGYVVLIFGNSWTWWEHVHWERKTACISHFWIFVKTQKNGPFLRPKKCFWVVFFCFPARNLYWQVRFAKKCTQFGQSGPLEHRL